ncbi:hypothetical protein TWF106_009272 [Orbilia oligospora]|uniref:Uncharacterized protein n=1 Tax=Orbilia oligospora TaxID=2813651 RepID=A0A7C8UW67_ORBOL|nr:hypothetical protein TWF106_009272 [Orbilia oligospora]KAF3219861.1 hypothetical protein TWF679_010317 [Orbilia oligospora]
MSETSHGHQANEAATPIQSPTNGKLNIHEASGIASGSGSETSSPEARKAKASTFSVLSLDHPRRRALSPNTFDSNAISHPQVSSGASHPTIQLSHDSPNHSVRKLSATSVGEASEQSSPRQKENQKFSPELKKQLESLIAPDSRTTPQSSTPSTVSKSSRIGGWSIGTSSIALRPSEPAPSIVTTQLWEPEGTPEGSSESTESDRVPTPLSMSGYQSEYISFPSFESYPKNPRPGLRSRCSDKSWHLLQKLKGKIVEMHNAGLHSSRSSSRNSISSRKSRSPARPLAENQQPRTRAASESGGNRTRLDPGPSPRSKLKAATVSGGTLRTSASNLKRVSIAEPNSTAILITNLQRRSSTYRATIIAVTPEKGQHTPNQASEQTSEGQKEPTGLSGLTRPIEFASNIFQSLITVASGGSSKSTPVSPDRGGASGTNVSQLQDKGKPPQLTNQDSSEDEMTFMEYIKKFSDSSPTGTPKYPPFSAPSCDILAAEVQPEFSNTVGQAAPRTVTFKDPTHDNIRRGAAPMSPIQEADSSEEIPPEIALDPGTGKTLIKYTAGDYDAITNYFYNVQTRVLKQKWPFLYGNEIKYLIDNKWLEMEWEDLEDWAQESARHVDDEDYVETDLFEDLTLVDPRGPDAPRQRSNLS